MTVVGRLKQGNLITIDEINERQPAVNNGLVKYLPFDMYADGLPSSNYFDITDISLSDFTLAFKFKPDIQYYNDGSMASEYNRIMLTMYDVDDIKKIDYTDWVRTPSTTLTTSSPFFDLYPNAEWDNVMHHWHSIYGYIKDIWHDYFIIKSQNILRIIVYYNGYRLCDQSFGYSESTKLDDFVLSKIRLGYADINGVWKGNFKDVCIYNRILATDEANTLCKRGIKMSSSGTLYDSKIIEELINVPSDVFYFPLGFNSKEKSRAISPIVEENTVYENGAVWVGSAATNLAKLTEYTATNNTGSTSIVIGGCPTPINGLSVYGVQKTNDIATLRIQLGVTALQPSQTYSASMYLYVDAPDNEYRSPYVREHTFDNPNGDSLVQLEYNGKSVSMLKDLPQKKWIRMKASNVTSSSNVQYWSLASYLSKNGETIYMTGPQYENIPFVTPFTSNTRGPSTLKYSFSSMGVNVNSDPWMVGLFATTNPYLMRSGNAVQQTYNRIPLLELGSYYMDGQSNITLLHPADSPVSGFMTLIIYDNKTGKGGLELTLDSEEITGNYVFYTIGFNGNELILRTISCNGIKTRTLTKNWTSPIADILNVGGYGWSGATPYWMNNQWNGYVKDMIVAKRVLSDDEVKNIFNVQMRIQKDCIRVQNKIMEGEVL